MGHVQPAEWIPMSLDPDDLCVEAWVRDCAKHIVCLDPSIRPAQAETLARSFWSERSGDEDAPSPVITADRMLAPRAQPLRWLE